MNVFVLRVLSYYDSAEILISILERERSAVSDVRRRANPRERRVLLLGQHSQWRGRKKEGRKERRKMKEKKRKRKKKEKDRKKGGKKEDRRIKEEKRRKKREESRK